MGVRQDSSGAVAAKRNADDAGNSDYSTDVGTEAIASAGPACSRRWGADAD
jgi:hypothetical protein